MNAKEFLQKAYKIDQRINSKLEQIQSLRELAERVTSVLSHTPKSGSGNKQVMENSVVGFMDLENELLEDIHKFMEVKKQVRLLIDSIPDPDCCLLLEYRYLSLKSWEEICALMNYSWSGLHKLHKKSLQFIERVNESVYK